MLVEYDAASKLLSAALNSKDVQRVLKSRDELEMLKLQAKRVLDRQLLADATEFQMRVERWLGVLLGDAKNAGYLGEGRKRKDEGSRVTLRDLGIDRKLSARAQKAAALKDDAFAEIVSDVRTRIVSGGAHQLNPNSATRGGSAASDESLFDRPLLDGTRIGNVRLGKLRGRIEALVAEAKLLQAIHDHVGGSGDGLATVASAISEHKLQEIVLGIE
ncbi:hypothetical protein MA20_31965 [Bradyrhizobium japonicum]|uniref:Uncharacterized protein n=1 Tax=Bradyrhizobium japonicum TaxID=375 RepID=A0A0A3XR94_BRAJP|nr:hypothetical protein [Bradyrhizobium japonicum]KGT75809.1 hypothetical protein MA20_31965 [Bradyrhizobium japonicum]